MDFKPLDPEQRKSLYEALMSNTEKDTAILMNPRDTSFLGVADEVNDDEVISAIKSIPCHY